MISMSDQSDHTMPFELVAPGKLDWVVVLKGTTFIQFL